jgi:predicted ABC-type ATPase
MVVVAGPPGSGKSIRFKAQDFGVDAFNVDDRCNELHGSYQGIPPAVRKQAQKECEHFILEHIRTSKSFATETTLRTLIAVQQAQQAKKAGFKTFFIYVATGDAKINIERVRLRGLAGGHSAPPEVIRETCNLSLDNLATALMGFDHCQVYDNSGSGPVLVLRVEKGQVVEVADPLPIWVRKALSGSPLAPQLK